MKKTVILPLILSIALIFTPNKAKAYVPVIEIIIAVQVAVAVAIAAKPLVEMAYKALKKKGKKFVAYIKRYRAAHNNNRDALEDDNVILPTALALAPANQNLDDIFNGVALAPQAPQKYGYSRTLKVVQEESNFMPPFAPALMPALPNLEERFKTVALEPQVPEGYGYSRKVSSYEEEIRYFGSGF